VRKWESDVERKIREAQERGEFDNLPGAGKPIPDLGKTHDELWWVKRLLKREGLSLVPETLELRRQVEKTMAEIARKKDESAVRRLVEEMNEDIARVNATTISGPPTNLAPFDVEEIVKRWRSGDL